MKRILIMLLSALLLTGCAPEDAPPETTVPRITLPQPSEATVPETTAPPETVPPDPIEVLMASMPLEDWVGQLFLVGAAPEHISDCNPGGFLLFAYDFQDPNAAEAIARWQSSSKIPLLIATDEEGGTVTRVSCHSHYRDSRFPSPRDLYAQGGLDAVLAAEAEKCELLRSLGVNVNLGPVCDITTDPNAFMYKRALGQNAETTGQFVSEMVQVMEDYYIGSALKHFPGYGNNTDTHTGIAIDDRSLAELEGCDLIPFRAGIDAGCGAVMVSHTIVRALDPELPASLSPAVHAYLRETMGFTGVIITDDLNMQAITDQYGAGEAAVQAVLAGNDILCCTAFQEQYKAVLAAALDGRIPYDTLKAAVRRVLEWKLQLGLL